MIDQKTIDIIYILQISVWVFKFTTIKITGNLNIIFIDKKQVVEMSATWRTSL